MKCLTPPVRSHRGLLALVASSFGLIMMLGSQAYASTNVLGNPGFETGKASPWISYGNALIESTNNVYYNGGQPGGSNVLTHSGTYAAKTYGLFNGANNYDGFYQDFPAAAGSVWTAAGYALTHEQDLMGFGNFFWFEVTFRDSTNGLLALYRSYIISPQNADFTSNVWWNLSVTNQYDISDTTFSTITNTVSSFTAPVGTAIVRYQAVFNQPASDGGSVYYDDLSLTRTADSNPDIYVNPSGTNITVTGKNAYFNVVAVGNPAPSYQWYKDGVALTNQAGRIFNAQNTPLVVINVGTNDAGNYTVIVSNSAGTITSLPATMTVNFDPIAAANLVQNPGFENSLTSPSPWLGFNGNTVVTVTNVYAGTDIPIKTHGGTNCLMVYNNGYSGVYQDVPCTPGTVWKAACWMLATTNDLDSWAGIGDGAVWMEVAFHGAAGPGVFLALYKSPFITATNYVDQRDTYVYFPVNASYDTNDLATIIETNTLCIAPPGSTSVRAQITRNNLEPGSAWVDDITLFELTPVTLTASNAGTSIKLSFKSSAGFNQQVVYTTDLNGGTWQVLSNFVGDTTIKSLTDPITATPRYYRVWSN